MEIPPNSSVTVPALLVDETSVPAIVLSAQERDFLNQARKLFEAEFYDHALLDIWNASVANLRRRIEIYGVDLFTSVVKDESGRKKYNRDGETLSERWSGVDDLVLIYGATNLGLLNKKAGKSLEMINWMRNHASPAHDSDNKVQREDVFGLVLILEKSLFETEMPDPGHSVSGLFDPVKSAALSQENVEILQDQIRGLRTADLRIAFGFMLDLLCSGEQPAFSNVRKLFPVVWERSSEELRKTVGLRYHSLTIDRSSDTSTDQAARTRLLDFITEVQGIQYVPDATRAAIYRRAVRELADAKNTSYGWASESSAAKTLAQFGPFVPSIAFEEVYQEILAVWCGNYWGRSNAYLTLGQFVDSLNTTQILNLARMFQSNERVLEELFQSKPNAVALELLAELKNRLSIQAHKSELDRVMGFLLKLKQL